jgi:hypothetical protein
MPLIRSETVVFHETTNGPFKREDTDFASWAPEEDDEKSARGFQETLTRSVDRFLSEIHHRSRPRRPGI